MRVACAFSLNAVPFLCVYCLCMFCFVFIFYFYVRVPHPLTAAGSKAAGERASPAAFPGRPARRARLPPAPHSHPPAGQGSGPRGQRACHPANSQHRHPTHPVHPLDTCPGGQQQQVGVWGAGGQERAGGAGRAGACLREP